MKRHVVIAAVASAIGVLVATLSVSRAQSTIASKATAAKTPDAPRSEGFVATHTGAIALPSGGAAPVGGLLLPSGKFVVTARVVLTNAGPPARARCLLGSDAIDVTLNEGARPASDLPVVLTTALDQGGADKIELKCGASGGRISATNIQISAVSVAALTVATF